MIMHFITNVATDQLRFSYHLTNFIDYFSSFQEKLWRKSSFQANNGRLAKTRRWLLCIGSQEKSQIQWFLIWWYLDFRSNTLHCKYKHHTGSFGKTTNHCIISFRPLKVIYCTLTTHHHQHQLTSKVINQHNAIVPIFLFSDDQIAAFLNDNCYNPKYVFPFT